MNLLRFLLQLIRRKNFASAKKIAQMARRCSKRCL